VALSQIYHPCFDCEAECGKPVDNSMSVHIRPYIVHGSNAEAGRWPWHVAIVLDASLLCSGSLVDEYHVITAAHCIW